jgi:hypothetical protein
MFEFGFKTKTCFQKEKKQGKEINKRKTPSAPPLSRRPSSPGQAVPCAPLLPPPPPGPSSAFPLVGPHRERPSQPFSRPRRSKPRTAHPTPNPSDASAQPPAARAQPPWHRLPLFRAASLARARLAPSPSRALDGPAPEPRAWWPGVPRVVRVHGQFRAAANSASAPSFPCPMARTSRVSPTSRVRFARVVTRCLCASRVPLTHVARLVMHRSHISRLLMTRVARRLLVIINCFRLRTLTLIMLICQVIYFRYLT